jgi:hypothetical protein
MKYYIPLYILALIYTAHGSLSCGEDTNQLIHTYREKVLKITQQKLDAMEKAMKGKMSYAEYKNKVDDLSTRLNLLYQRIGGEISSQQYTSAPDRQSQKQRAKQPHTQPRPKPKSKEEVAQEQDYQPIMGLSKGNLKKRFFDSPKRSDVERLAQTLGKKS